MKKQQLARLIVLAACVALPLGRPAAGSATSQNQDVNTVLVDHFEDATSATYVSGAMDYIAGPAGYGSAANFSSGSWVRYDLPSWYGATGVQGTVDFWVYPMQTSKVFLDINWSKTTTIPGGGHVLSFILMDDRRVMVGTWPAIGFASAAAIPLNQWTHIWFTWGDEGTRLYLNGELDRQFGDKKYPGLNALNYLYVPAWTQPGVGYIDEVRIRRTYERVPCAVYPIAVASSTLANAVPGQILPDVFNGAGAGNFGWMSWTGSTEESDLVASLTPPGTSSAYVNPDNPADRELSVGDWVMGYPGLSNSEAVRERLDALKGTVVVVPVWDDARNQGDSTAYRVAGFARMRITSHQLPAKRITAEYLGPTTCPK